MGLAGRKQKQRIPADPRNLSWADDASRFGLSYLSKFGWDASQGLGISGEGMKTHIKAHQKLDMMGIGAQHQRDPNGIAWRQNKEFEALLKRLNEAEQGNGADGAESGTAKETAIGMMFVGAQVEEKSADELSLATTKKKRKHSDANNPSYTAKKKWKHEKSDSDIPSSRHESSSKPIPKPRPLAHRARIRAAKRIAGKSASAISEILGIAPSSSVSTSTSTPAPTPPSQLSIPDPQSSSHSLDNLTTSTKSVADYFKEKLNRCATASSTPSSSSTPGLSKSSDSSISPPRHECEPLRRGIGSRVPAISLPGLELESRCADGEAGGQDTLTEKLRRKAERRAEKRKRHEVKASPENVSAIEREHGEDKGCVQQTFKKEKKKRRERKQEIPPDDHDDDGINEKDTSRGSLLDMNKKDRKKCS